MKNIFIKLSLAALVFAAVSCDLTETPTSFVAPDDYFQSEAQCKASINGLYVSLKTIYSSDMMTSVEAVTDLLFVNTNNDNARLKISPSRPGFGSTLWQHCYQSIMRSNAVIYGIENSPALTDEGKAPLIAEAKVVRAFYYWLLTSFFGDVPFYTDRVADIDTMKEIAKMGRMSAFETRKALIEDLEGCVPSMQQARFADIKDYHMGAACGWMLIAKMAQWNKDWDTAINAIKHIEDIYGEFNETNYPLEDILFRCKNKPESIFEVQRVYVAGGLNVTHNTASISTPTHQGTTDIYDGVSIPEIGTTSTTWTSMRPTAYMSGSLQPRRGIDKRTHLNMAWDYNGITFKSVASRPWMGPKFWCPNLDQAADHNNNHIFRYADAILMQAENYAEKDQPEESVRYLNMVRQRAGTGDYSFKTKALLINEIQKERGRELVGEWQRKFDLVRWGIWYESVRDNSGRAEAIDNLRPCHEYYPIPSQQVTYSGGALDNAEYEKYGL